MYDFMTFKEELSVLLMLRTSDTFKNFVYKLMKKCSESDVDIYVNTMIWGGGVIYASYEKRDHSLPK